MLVVDGHLDLAMNALGWNRDLKLPVATMRQREAGMTQKGRAGSTVAFPEMRAGKVAVSFATLFARVGWPDSISDGLADADIAYASAHGQIAYYRILESMGVLRVIGDRATLDRHLAEWENSAGSPPLGVVIAMEGADPILSPEQVGEWWASGLRIVSLAHYGKSAYACGTGQAGPLTSRARPLLRALAEAGIILDLTHLSDESFFQAIDQFEGRVLASHSNCRALVPGDRQLTDDMIRLVVQRGGVIGAAMDAWMLYPGWEKGVTQPDVVSLEDYVNHIDHVCQIAGNAHHAAIGTDLDGGYGKEQVPHDLDTIADLQRVAELLQKRGYDDESVRAIMHGNWIRLLREAWS